jgi:ketoreductase RED1
MTQTNRHRAGGGTPWASAVGPATIRATVVGGGVIGISWTALFLAHGLEVTVCDPLPDVAERVRAGLREIAPTLAQLGLPVDDLTNGTDALGFDPDAASAVAGADVVQENGPERREVKQQLWSTIEAGVPANALLASSSSSSGIPASVMGQAMRQPGRLIIGHPFNPPHLVPLVEVVPSPGTDPEVVDAAVAFYRAMGKQPQVLSREIPGFVANRLQAALFREAVHLVAQGVVTEQELDAVVTSSIGMRWAVAGPFQTFQLGGGPGGLADFIVHLGPGLEALWAILGQPRLDADTTRLLTTQAEHFGGTVAELAARRDQAQIRLMQAWANSGPRNSRRHEPPATTMTSRRLRPGRRGVKGGGVDGESISAFQVLLLTALTAATCTTATCWNTGTTT